MKSLDKYMITTWVMHGINIIIHGIIVTIALLTLLTGNTDNFMGDFFADLFSLIFLLTSGVSFFGCLLFLYLFIILRKKKANTSYRIVNGFQMLFTIWLFIYGFILFAAVSKSGVFMFSLTSGLTSLSGLVLIVTSIHGFKIKALPTGEKSVSYQYWRSLLVHAFFSD
ncbi:MAG TPA: hypothetical protein PLJ98_00075 [Acholeplasmataceae bacterium]|jgi:hypothetical protein|nr:hypothetical protein [Acholeplasmataceae bacterium]HRX44441.1 hypothetical protein [Acholeplasmataceae bacterium]